MSTTTKTMTPEQELADAQRAASEAAARKRQAEERIRAAQERERIESAGAGKLWTLWTERQAIFQGHDRRIREAWAAFLAAIREAADWSTTIAAYEAWAAERTDAAVTSDAVTAARNRLVLLGLLSPQAPSGGARAMDRYPPVTLTGALDLATEELHGWTYESVSEHPRLANPAAPDWFTPSGR